MTSLELFRALILAMPVAVVPDATVDQFLATASCTLCADAWGAKFAEGSVWMAAHMLSDAGVLNPAAPGSGGVVTSLKTGDESIGFSSPTAPSGGSGSDAWLSSTKYGQRVMYVRDTREFSGPTHATILC